MGFGKAMTANELRNGLTQKLEAKRKAQQERWDEERRQRDELATHVKADLLPAEIVIVNNALRAILHSADENTWRYLIHDIPEKGEKGQIFLVFLSKHFKEQGYVVTCHDDTPNNGGDNSNCGYTSYKMTLSW